MAAPLNWDWIDNSNPPSPERRASKRREREGVDDDGSAPAKGASPSRPGADDDRASKKPN